MKDFEFISSFAIDDFKKRYAGSRFGMLWAFAQPTMTIIIYWFVFQIGFRSQPVNGQPYILWLVSGLIPWFFVSECISGSIGTMLEYRYLVKHVVFNIRILPIIKVISSLFIQIFLIVFTMILFGIFGCPPALYYVQIIYYLLYSIIICIGFSFLLSATYVFFRDIGQLVNVILQIIFWFTPIVWNIEGMPSIVKSISSWNPLFYIIQGYRDSFTGNVFFYEYGLKNVYFWFIALFIIFIGYRIFCKCMDQFADVI